MDRKYPTDATGRHPAAAANSVPDSGLEATGSPADVAAALVARLLSDAGRALTLEGGRSKPPKRCNEGNTRPDLTLPCALLRSPGTGIGDEGATALAEELRQLLGLTRLNLGGECLSANALK